MSDCPFCGTNLKGTSLDRHLRSFCFAADSDSTGETNSIGSERIEQNTESRTFNASPTVGISGGDNDMQHLSIPGHIEPSISNDISHIDIHINTIDNEEYEIDYDYGDEHSNYSSDADDDYSDVDDSYFVLDNYFSSDDYSDELPVDDEKTARLMSMETVSLY